MLTEKNIKTILLVLLLLSIIVYTLLTDVSTYFLSSYLSKSSMSVSSNILSAVKIVSAITSIFTVLITIKSKYISKKILGDNYIAGKYEGKSYKTNENKEIIYEHKEYIEIKQNLISTVVVGVSKEDKTDVGYANWNGSLIKNENSKFLFLVEIETPYSSYLEVISMNFINNSVHGFISSSSSKDLSNWKFTLNKIKEKNV